FFFSSRRRHTRFSRDWSSDVCSSDLATPSSKLSNKASTPRPSPPKAPPPAKETPAASPSKSPPVSRCELLFCGPPSQFVRRALRSEERRVGKEGRSGWLRNAEKDT